MSINVCAKFSHIKTPRDAFNLGLREGFGMPAFVLFASMTGFGSLAHESELSIGVAVASSLLIWGLPGQVAMAELYAVGAPLLAIVVAVSMANMRFLPMAFPLVPQFRGNRLGWKWRYVLIHFMSINTWAAALRRSPALKPEQCAPYFLGFSLVCISSGALGTFTGFHISGSVPLYITVSLIFLNPAYFAYMFSTVRQRNCILALIAGVFLGPVFYLISPNWGLPICGLIAGTIGFVLDKFINDHSQNG